MEGNTGCFLPGAAETVLAGAVLCLPSKRRLLDDYFGNSESETEASEKATPATPCVMHNKKRGTGLKRALATRTNHLYERPSLPLNKPIKKPKQNCSWLTRHCLFPDQDACKQRLRAERLLSCNVLVPR